MTSGKDDNAVGRLSFGARKAKSSGMSDKPTIEPNVRSDQPVDTPATIRIAAPDDIRDYTLRREHGESAKSHEERKQLFDTLLKLGGR